MKPILTRHAGDQWDTRTQDDSVAPETAWDHGQRIQAGAPFHGVDEVRYHRATGTLLLRKASTLMTVYDVDELQPDAYHAVKHALEAPA